MDARARRRALVAVLVRTIRGRARPWRTKNRAAVRLHMTAVRSTLGPTSCDVRAGRAVGARVVGVAMPGSTAARAELEAAGADVIVDGCSEALVDAVLS